VERHDARLAEVEEPVIADLPLDELGPVELRPAYGALLLVDIRRIFPLPDNCPKSDE
jgi:hypothetical protein